METAAGAATRSAGGRIAFCLVLAAALAVRSWFGWFDPSPARFFDERYALQNVGRILATGELTPANGYHPSLSYLPPVVVLGGCQLLAEWTGDDRLRVLATPRARRADAVRASPAARPAEQRAAPSARPAAPRARPEATPAPALYPFTPLAYRLGRLLQALLGTATVAATFCFGRRFGGQATGLLAAWLVAVTPQAVRQSAIINEDTLLVLATLAAVMAARRAAVAGRLRDYLLAGVVVGLAMSSKFTGVAAALPLVAVTAVRPRSGRRWAWLVAAGAAAAVTFALLNPYVFLRPELYRQDFGRTLHDYEKKSEREDRSRLGVVTTALTAATAPLNLGPLAGGAALAGVALLGVQAVRRRTADPAATVALLGFVLGYPALYSLATGNVPLHNWLPMMPLMAIAAAYAATGEMPRLLARWVPAGTTRAVATVVLLAGSVPLIVSTYRWTVPTTISLAADELGRRLAQLRGTLVLVAPPLTPVTVKSDGHRAAVAAMAGDPVRWRAADAVIVPSSALAELPADAARFLATDAEPPSVVRPRLGHARGPQLHVFPTGWRRAGGERRLSLVCAPGGARWAAQGGPRGGTHASLLFALKGRARGLVVDGVPRELYPLRRIHGHHQYASAKFPLPPQGASPSRIAVLASCTPGERLAAWWFAWERPRAPQRRSGSAG